MWSSESPSRGTTQAAAALAVALACALLPTAAGAAATSARREPRAGSPRFRSSPVARATAAGNVRHAPLSFAPSVQAMIVGRGERTIWPARTITAAATSLDVGGRSCAVASATPLAVLAAVRSAGGPGFSIRDYGHCGSSQSSSAELFVYSLAGQSNSGQSGWEYKVGGAAGSTGAGDPSGPSGDGQRLRAGERVLWFWCEARGGGCQRTLEVSAERTTHGRAFTATVYGYDNEGRGAPVAGALVSIGASHALTGSHGRATLRAPGRPGRSQLSATRAGMVPSFPVTLAVG